MKHAFGFRTTRGGGCCLGAAVVVALFLFVLMAGRRLSRAVGGLAWRTGVYLYERELSGDKLVYTSKSCETTLCARTENPVRAEVETVFTSEYMGRALGLPPKRNARSGRGGLFCARRWLGVLSWECVWRA